MSTFYKARPRVWWEGQELSIRGVGVPTLPLLCMTCTASLPSLLFKSPSSASSFFPTYWVLTLS